MAGAPTVAYDYLLSVLDKAETGPILNEANWDRECIHQTIQTLVQEYDIVWDRETPGVPYDDALADRVFEAGMDLACRSGVYCLDTRRRMVWSRAELEQVLADSPDRITIGQGNDTVAIAKRSPDEHTRVAVIGGAYGIPVPEDLYVPMMVSYAQEPLIEFIENASLLTTHGRPIRADSPWDAVACWQEVGLTFEALDRVNRPGLSVGCANSAAGLVGELATTTYGGFRPTDWHHNAFISELKVSYADLIKATHFVHTGSFSHNFYNPIYGGYVGGGFGLAVAMVAGMILLRACLWGQTVNPGPSHAHWSCNTHPDMIAAQAVAFQGLNRNTHLLTSGIMRPVAGPCVKDMLYEVAALTLASVVSGVAFVKGVQSATGRVPRHCSGLEARFMAQVAHAAEKLTRRDADPLVKGLTGKYKDSQHEMRFGKPFEEIYDPQTVQPTAEWRHMVEEVCEELEQEFGLSLE